MTGRELLTNAAEARWPARIANRASGGFRHVVGWAPSVVAILKDRCGQKALLSGDVVAAVQVQASPESQGRTPAAPVAEGATKPTSTTGFIRERATRGDRDCDSATVADFTDVEAFIRVALLRFLTQGRDQTLNGTDVSPEWDAILGTSGAVSAGVHNGCDHHCPEDAHPSGVGRARQPGGILLSPTTGGDRALPVGDRKGHESGAESVDDTICRGRAPSSS